MGKVVSIYAKKTVRFGELTFPQQTMVKLGTVGLSSVLNRIQAALGPIDLPAKPLTKNYAIYKTRHGLRNVRDLRGFGGQVFLDSGKRRKKAKWSPMGHMLDNLSLRTVSENKANIGFTLEQARIKAAANQMREIFLVFSPKNRAAIMEAARRIFLEITNKLPKAA